MAKVQDEMDASEIVRLVGIGIQSAFKANTDFLGMEKGFYENADIKPEYISTVKLAESFVSTFRIVKPETKMRDLRSDASMQIVINHMSNGNDRLGENRKKGRELAQKLKRDFRFNKEESDQNEGQKIDISVCLSDRPSPPNLLLEIKLG